MEIRKGAFVAAEEVPAEKLTAINRLAKKPLGASEVYVFSVRLCDDQVDRDGERFDTKALPELARLFVGKTGILDHSWSAEKQVARIFETEVRQEGGACYIKAWAYLLRTKQNEAVIAAIDGGILKEVSVGCAMGKRVCSICGQEMGSCGHRKGETYGGAVCAAVLCEPKDAYEFSFVAVPAQPEAGVLKAWKGGEGLTLEDCIEKHCDVLQQDAFLALKREAEMGRQYREKLEGQVVRLGMALDFGMEEAVLRSVVKRMEVLELERVGETMGKKAAELFPGKCQLCGGNESLERIGEAFLI